MEKSGFITSRSGLVVAKSKRFFSAFFSFLFSSQQCESNIAAAAAAAAGCGKLNAFQEAAREERRTGRDGRRRRPNFISTEGEVAAAPPQG